MAKSFGVIQSPSPRSGACGPGKAQKLSFRNDCRGTTAIEFSILIIPALMFFAAVVEIGFLYYATQRLQLAADSIGRPIRTSSLASVSSMADLIREKLCSNNGGLLKGTFDCDKIRVDIRSPEDWSKADMSNDYDNMQLPSGSVALPAPGKVAIVRVGYPLPNFLGFNFFPGSAKDGSGKSVRMISGVSAFRVEPQ